MKLLFTPICFFLMILTSCTSVKKSPSADLFINDPCLSAYYILNKSHRPKIGLVLGGGSARGFAHIGVIQGIEKLGIPIDLIVGTSIGSLIGALYASNPNSAELQWIAQNVEKSDIFDFSIISGKMGPVPGERIEEFIRKNIKIRNIEQTKIPFIAVATNLNRGTIHPISNGPIDVAVHASAAIPGIFSPVKIGTDYYVDGGVLNNIPIDIAINNGMDVVIAVDIQNDRHTRNIHSLIDVILHSVTLMMSEISNYQLDLADIVIQPDVSKVEMFDFTKKLELIRSGLHATTELKDTICSVISNKGNFLQLKNTSAHD